MWSYYELRGESAEGGRWRIIFAGSGSLINNLLLAERCPAALLALAADSVWGLLDGHFSLAPAERDVSSTPIAILVV